MAPEHDFLAGGGETGALMRAYDWAATPLGPPETWPQALKTLVGVMLSSQQPMLIVWGPKHTTLYNDGYAVICGARHPAALGKPFDELWHDIWDQVEPILARAYAGEATHMDDIAFVMHRHGYPEETHFAFGYTPVRLETGAVAGMFCACIETTGQVLAKRHNVAERERLEQLFQQAPGFIAMLRGPEHRIELANPAFLRLVGHREVVGRTVAEALPDAVEQGYLDLLNEVYRSGKAFSSTGAKYAAQAMPGGPVDERYVDFVYQPVADAEGRVTGIFVEGSDATERVQAEKTLREREERLRLVIEGAQDHAIFTTDPQGAITTWSAGAAAIFGWSADEAVGQSAAMLFMPEDRAAGAVERELSTAAREGYANDERWHLRKDGSRVFMNGSVHPLPRDAQGREQGFLKIARDETERRAAQDVLSESEARFRNMADHAPVMMWVTDPTGFCTYLNRRWYEFTGQTEAEAEGFGWLDATHPDDKAEAERVFLAANAAQAPFRVEYRLRRADGAYRWAIDAATPRFGVDGAFLGYIGSVIDIDDRRETEDRLRASEARLRTLTNSLPAFVWFAAEDGDLQFFNDRWYEYTGQTPEEALPNGWIATLHPDDVERTAAAWADARARGAPYEIEVRYRRRDGEYRWHVARALPLRDGAGRITAWFGTSSDTHDRRLAEEALRLRGEEFYALADNIPSLCWIAYADGNIFWYNRRWYEYTGTTPDSQEGWGWESVHDPEMLPAVVARWKHSVATGEPFEMTFPLKGADGVFRPFLTRIVPIRDEAGRVARWFGTNVDITEQRQTEARLEKSVEERTAERDRLWRLSRDPFLIADTEGRWLSVSPVWTELLGWSEQDLVGRTSEWMEHPDDRAKTRAEVDHLAEGGTTLRFENRFRRKDGGYRWFSWTAVAEGELLYCVARDITAEKEQAEALAHAEAQLRQAQKMESVGQLTGGIAHDFNNMLAIVVGSLDMASRRLARGDARVELYLDNAAEGAKRAATLTQRLLAFSRQQPLAPEVLDVNKLVAGMSELLRRTLGERIEIETVLAGGLWRTHVDPNQLESAILNLAVNARDAMPDGGKLTIETANAHLDDAYAADNLGLEAGQYVAICVTDAGSGMPPDVIAKAFDPFFTTKGVGKGTGLGLSQVYGFVKQSDGHVKIYSEPDRGTTVKVYLRRHFGADQARLAPADAAHLPEGSEVVLVVEDEEQVRQMSVEALRELGYTVYQASGGAEALDLIDSLLPGLRLLFTDIVMPGMTGRELAEAALARHPDLKVLYTTGYTKNAVVHNGVLDPGVAFLTKPFTVAELAAKVRAALDAGSVYRPARD